MIILWRWLLCCLLLSGSNTWAQLPEPVVHYQLDESGYSGSAGEVRDRGTAGLHGRAFNGIASSDLSPAIRGTPGTCRYGQFDGVDDYIEVSDAAVLDLAAAVSVGAWIRLDALPADLAPVVSKDENYEFHINSTGRVYWWWRDSRGNTRSLTSSSGVVSGEWAHVAISYRDGNQVLFLNGVVVASSSFSGLLMENNDPLQIGADQNLYGRYLHGAIDEVAVFASALSQNQVLELMQQTHPCGALNSCSASFVDGLASHNGGQIYFGSNAQLFNSPSNVLSVSRVYDDRNASARSCVTVACRSNGLSAPAIEAPEFLSIDFDGRDKDRNRRHRPGSEYVADGSSVTLGPLTTQFNRVSVGRAATLTFAGGASDYRIGSLQLLDNAVLHLAPGNYWIENLIVGNHVRWVVDGKRSVRIYARQTVNIGSGFVANSPDSGSGDASRLFLFGYGDVNIGDQSRFSGLIYARGSAQLGRSATLYGAVTAANIMLQPYVRVYYLQESGAAMDFGDLCPGASCALGGFQIQQPTYGLACPFSRSDVRIQALCADGMTIKTDYVGTLALGSTEASSSHFFASASASGDDAISDVTLGAEQAGETSVSLFHANENTHLRVTVTDRESGIAATAAAGTDIRTQGFALAEAPEDFICGATTSLSLVAIGEDSGGRPCQQLSGFTGIKALKSWFTANNVPPPAVSQARIVATALLLNGQGINAQQQPDRSNLELMFVQGRADLTLGYLNTAELLGIHFRYDAAPYSDAGEAASAGIGSLHASTDRLLVRPAALTLNLADNNGQCLAADASCSPFVAAGASFSQTLSARCADGSLATDFIGEVLLGSERLAPVAGVDATLAISTVAISAADAGDRVLDQQLDEVGVFRFNSRTSYFGQTVADYNSEPVGRFYPHHFVALDGVFSQACGAFTYMGQAGMLTTLRVQARNTNNEITRNYQQGFARASALWAAENNQDGIDLSTRLQGGSALVWDAGEALVTDSLTLLRHRDGGVTRPDGPFSALAVGVGIDDGDGGLTLLQGMNMNPASHGVGGEGCVAAGGCIAQQLGTADLRFGVLQIENAFGPEESPLDQAVHVLQFDGSGWPVNSDDNCTPLDVSAAVYRADADSWSGNLSAADTSAMWWQDIQNGEGWIRHLPPGMGHNGSVRYRYQAPSWLSGEFDGDGDYNDDSTALISFGQFRGNDRVIYWREAVR